MFEHSTCASVLKTGSKQKSASFK